MRYMRWVAGVLIVISAVAVCCYFAFCPMMKQFPPLTGPYHVGVTTVHTEDTSRKETLGESHELHGHRRLTLHIWYPANHDHQCIPSTYLAGKMPFIRQAFAAVYPKVAPFASCLLQDIPTHACRDAEVSQEQDRYSVVIFSHGLLGLSSDTYNVILEELASHGFVVVGIDHTFLNLATVVAQGVIRSSTHLSEQFARMPVAAQAKFQSMAIHVYQADIRFVIDELERYNNDEQSRFHHKLDLDHVGVMGHSAGGTAALEVSRADARLKACVDLDGWYDHIISWKPMPIPTLLLFGSKSTEIFEPTDEYLKRKELTRGQYYERERRIVKHEAELCAGNKDCSKKIIHGASHGDFSDEILFKWPLRPWSAPDSYKLAREINHEIAEFFMKYI